jgi:hypothetical protein
MVLECVGAVLMRWEPREPQKAAVEKRSYLRSSFWLMMTTLDDE